MEWAACPRQGDQYIRERKSLGERTLRNIDSMTNLGSASARYAHMAPEEVQPP